MAVLALWVELAAWLAGSARSAGGPDRWLYAIGFFFTLFPVLALVVYRWPLVFDLFRSVRVGVVNLIFVGLGAIGGVLWHQEDPNHPLPPDGMAVLLDPQRRSEKWTPATQAAWRQFDEFRNAHAYFTYKLLHGLGFHLLPGASPECTVDEAAIQRQLDLLRERLPELRDRFGEEFAAGLEANSARGLRTRAQLAEIGAFERSTGDFWWTLFVWSDRLDLIRVYRSEWYAALWAILFFGVLSNTFRGGWRRLLRPAKWGFAITHAGVLLVVVGAFWGRLAEERGMVELHVGETQGAFQLYRGGVAPFRTRPPLGLSEERPFALRLDGFRADYFDVLDVLYARQDAQGALDFEFPLDRQPKERLYPGQRLNYDYGPAWSGSGREREPWLRLEVLELYPKAEIRSRLRPAAPGEEGARPMSQIVVRGGGADAERILTHVSATEFDPLFEPPLVHGPSGTRVRCALAGDADEARRVLAQAVPSRYGRLRLSVPDGAGGGATVDVLPGERRQVEVAGATYEVEILSAVPRLRLESRPDGTMGAVTDTRPVERQVPDNPAVRVRLTGPGVAGKESWVLEQEFHPEARRIGGLELEFAWDRWSAPAAQRWILFQLPDGSVWSGLVGDPGSLQPLSPGTGRSLGDADLVLVQSSSRGSVDQVPVELAGVDFFYPAAPAARLRATTPEGQREFILNGAEGSPPEILRYAGPDGRERLVFLRLREDLDDLPLEWRSKLTVLEERPGPAGEAGAAGARRPRLEPVSSGEIRVNDYFVHGGYRFFQTNADARDPTYSGVGVVYDPGIETVLLGLYMLAGGVVAVFIVRPLLTRGKEA